ncbi:hypothetical protein AGRA3207_003428 [Actinomadura graeca]|uniref:Uncharacterized protein n=1 Tax=Actinomadura graeca TaxID=2750812 RepID=A0ABX8QXH5_9ACTN|nr:hypothetical protein [Actinomadura graeca]QXJ22432.1 hypothetical protein AGRA3207_003428 [Actinomadura graeca]
MPPADEAPEVGRIRPGCPVCGCPIAHEEARCAECRWPLHGEWRLGAPTPDALRDFEERLAAARRERDLLAVVRAGLTGHVHVRGGTPDPQEWARARRAVDAPPMSDAPLQVALTKALERMRPGHGLVIAEVGADHALTVIRVGLDGLAIPRGHDAAETIPWETAVPALSRDPGERRFQLAGGLAGLDRDLLWRSLRDALPQRLDEPGDEVLLVHRELGWPVPDRAARILRKRHPNATVVPAGGTGARELIGPLADALPARHDVGLLAAEVEPGTRRVRPRLIPLFPAGTPAGTRRAVSLARPPGDPGATVLAAVAASADQWTLLAAGAATLPADVEVVLDGPGRVRITGPEGLRPVTERLPELLGGLPERLEILTEPVDLICAVELGGVDELVRRRLDLLRELVAVLDATYPAGGPGAGLIRVAVLGYRDHAYGRGKEKRKPVLGGWLGTPASAAGALSRLGPSPIEYPEAAPVEDVLHEIADRLAHTRAAAGGLPPPRTVLLTVGGRPPHPPVQGDGDVLPCQFERSWAVALTAIARAGVACTTVLGGGPGGPGGSVDMASRDHPAWEGLAAAGLHDLDDIDARRLGVGLGLLPSAPQTLTLPLAELERGTR